MEEGHNVCRRWFIDALSLLFRLSESLKLISGEGCEYMSVAEYGTFWITFNFTSVGVFEMDLILTLSLFFFYLVAAKSASVRALLFDISFLMLCHVVQTYGSEVGLTPSTKAIYVSDLGPYSESVSEQESWTRVRPPFTSPVDSASLSCSFSTAPLGGQNTQ